MRIIGWETITEHWIFKADINIVDKEKSYDDISADLRDNNSKILLVTVTHVWDSKRDSDQDHSSKTY